jgi:uncharacterized protein (TIGR03437 family)
LFDGVPAPMVYASRNQMTVIAPYSLQGKTTTEMSIIKDGVSSAAVALSVAPTGPGIFTRDASGRGLAAAISASNGRANGPENPASRGDFVQLYLTGEGLMQPNATDGLITGTSPSVVAASTTAQIGGVDAEVSYAGQAPGLVAGVAQINVRIPAGVSSGAQSLVVRVGGQASQSNVTIQIQ